jgi:uncharacterized protein involved in outer membrane biogenesis
MCEKKQSGCFCKAVKICLWAFVGVLLFAVLAVATLPLWISPVSTSIAECVVPKYTGTDFKLDRFYLNPWTGALRINGVKLSNPDGFGKYAAFSVSSVSVDVEIGELFSNKLHIRDVNVEGAFASYFSHDGKNNFEVIMDNVNRKLGSEKKDEAAEKVEDKKDVGEGMKVIIDHIRIAGTSVKIAESDIIPPLPIMTIELRDIGKDSGGLKFSEVGKALTDAFMKAMNSMGDGLGALGSMLGDGMGNLSKSVESFGESTKGSMKAVSGALGNAGNSASAAAESLSKGAKDAAGSVADSTSSALSTIGDGAKSAADAVGDTTKKAAEGVKNLFKGFGK